MTENKKPFVNNFSGNGDQEPTTHMRAKNQTVMLTPEITGQVRAMLQQEANNGAPVASQPPQSESIWQKPEETSGGGGFSGSGFGSIPSSEESASEPFSRPAESLPQSVAASQTSNYVPARRASTEDCSVELIVNSSVGKLVGFMISFDKAEDGEMVELRAGRWIVSSQPSDQGNTILIQDQTVSPLHAIIRVGSDGVVQVMDQLAEFGTVITRFDTEEEEEIVGAMTTVEHGDIVSFGEVNFTIVMIPFQSDASES